MASENQDYDFFMPEDHNVYEDCEPEDDVDDSYWEDYGYSYDDSFVDYDWPEVQ